MARRLVLIVGSQCAALPSLSFLPTGPGPVVVEELPAGQRMVAELRDLLVDGPGGCSPVRVEGESSAGLLINPTQQVADAALVRALAEANQQEAVLVVCFVGHGTRYQADPAAPARHLLHVFDTVASPEGTEPEDRAWDPYETVARRRSKVADMVGLVLLVDACYASWAKQQVDAWSGVKGGLLAAWLGSSGDHEAWDACFTRTLIHVLEDGLEAGQHPRQALVPDILVVDLEPTLGERCRAQAPRLGGFESHNPVLSLGRNRRASELGATLGLDPTTETLLLRLTDHYVTFAIDPVVDAIRQHRVVVVVGRAGTGKSALAAVLRHPPASAVDVPLVGVHAVAFLHAASSIPELARTLGSQLDRLAVFPEATRRAEHANPAVWESLDPWQRLLAVLRVYPDPVRLLLDGFDQLTGQAGQAIQRALTELVADPGLGHVRVILTGRSVPDLPGIDATLDMPPLDPVTATHYVTARGVDPAQTDRVLDIAGGNWLVLQLAADALTANPAMGAADLRDLYVHLIAQVRQRQGPVVDELLAVLAAAGTGPVLPFDILHESLEQLDHRLTRAQLHTVLGDLDLHRLIDRTHPGQPEEHLGLFHQTLTEHLTDQASRPDEVPEPTLVHRAMAAAVEKLAPASRHVPATYRSDPLLAYAFTAGPRHLYLAGRTEELVAELVAREDPIPNVNLARVSTWATAVEEATGSDDASALTLRANLADWNGRTGDIPAAIRQSREVLADALRVLGPEHPETLAIRASLARWTGVGGATREALDMCDELLPALVRVLGADDHHTLAVRNNVAVWTGESGQETEALRLFQQLLPDRTRLQGPDHPETLIARANIAFWTGRTGHPSEAMRLYRELLPDRIRVLGPDHPDTLTNRNNIAYWTSKSGDPEEALRLSRELLVDRERVLGTLHPECLTMRGRMVFWTAQTGHPDEALSMSRALLADLAQALGPDHPKTLLSRAEVARRTGETGDREAAVRLLQELLPDQERVLGRDHPDCRATRDLIASMTRRGGSTVPP